MATKIKYLTDDIIQLYTGGNVLTDWRDFNLHHTRNVVTYDHGVYDAEIFGSMFSNQCNCGQVRTVGTTCPKCKSKVLDEVSAYRRYGRIDLPVYYCSTLKFKNLVSFLRSNLQFKFDVQNPAFLNQRGGVGLDERVLENLQFTYIKSVDDEGNENNYIQVTDNITDVTFCSYEGLMAIISQYYPSLLNEYRSYINTTLLVVPVIMRAPRYSVINGESRLKNDQLTVIYQNIIYSIQTYYNEWYPKCTTESGKALFRGTFRRYIVKMTDSMSRLLNASKANLARTMQSNRMGNSGRATVVPAPDLPADEVYIPRHLMYEACREEFTKYISEHLNVGDDQAEMIYKSEANTDTVQKLFDDYIEGDPEDVSTAKYVFINRNPSLHKLNIIMCRVRLTNDYAMKIPMVLCNPTAGDFDGDTYSFYSVPKKSNKEFLETMGPENLIYYQKNHIPLFTPSHESMMGLIYATKIIIPDELEEFESYEEAYQFKRKNRNFKWQTQFLYKGEPTTLGRMKLSELFGKDINAYLGDFNKTLDAKNIIPLYANLQNFDDRLDRIQKIQEFSLNIATTSGATAPTLSQLYSTIDSKYLDRIRVIENEKFLSDREKEIKIRDIYKRYQDEVTEKFDPDVKLTITESSRAKISQLMNIVTDQFNVSPDGTFHVSKSRLIDGMTPEDYTYLAIENRAVQDIKVSGVPLGGFLTRQFAFLAMSYYYEDGEDPTNKGIEIKAKDAIGRTTTDGKIVPENKSDDIIQVRSLVTSTYKNRFAITPDMLSNLFHYKDGSRVGIDLMTSTTEGLTQSSLSLKHGGALFEVEPNGNIYAKENCSVQLNDDWILIRNMKGILSAFPRSRNFVLSFTPTGNYKKGELIGSTYKMNTPVYRLDSVISLCGARATNPNKRFAKNTVLATDCYASNSGPISYKKDKQGRTHVYIDGVEYQYNPDSLYYFPEGALVKKYDRICSGVLSIQQLMQHEHKYIEIFYHFRNQMTELFPDVAKELFEFLFVLIVKKNDNGFTVNSIISSIANSESFYTSVAFGSARNRFKKLTPEGIEFKSDTLTQVALSLITGNKIL